MMNTQQSVNMFTRTTMARAAGMMSGGKGGMMSEGNKSAGMMMMITRVMTKVTMDDSKGNSTGTMLARVPVVIVSTNYKIILHCIVTC